MAADYSALSGDDLNLLAGIVGDDYLSIRAGDLAQHAGDQSFHPPVTPEVVIWPENAQQVGAVLAYASARRIAVTARGAGTSLEGNPIPSCAGIVLNLARMDRILDLHAADFQVVVEPGLTYKAMNARLARQGLFFAPDPGADASIGGMIANNAAGTRTLRYGATRDNVLQLEAVLASGEIIRCGTRARKSASGYDLVHLLIGSEGTLAIITQATLKLAPIPSHRSALIATFADVAAAARVVSAVMGSGIIPAALELIDAASLAVLNQAGLLQLPQEPALLFELHSISQLALEEELALVGELCQDGGCRMLQTGIGRAEADRLWRLRHLNYELKVQQNPGKAILVADVAVPVSRYPELVAAAQEEIQRRGLHGYLIGHAGDGNLHPEIVYVNRADASYAQACDAVQAIVTRAIEWDGTASGEHGIGIGKRQYMALEHGLSLDLMRRVKDALDPQAILNPGKIFP